MLEQVSAAPVTCGCVHYFQVGDVDAKYDELSAAGVTWIQPAQKVYWGYGSIIADPDGHILYLWDEKSMKQNDSSD